MSTIDRMDEFFASGAGIAITVAGDMYSSSVLSDVFSKYNRNGELVTKYGGRHAKKYAAGNRWIRKPLSKLPGGLIATPAERAVTYTAEKAMLDAGRNAVKNGGKFLAGQSLIPAELSKVSNALKYAKFSKAITGLWGLTTAATVATSAVDYFRQRGAEGLSQKYNIGSEGFADSNMAFTSRQRALRAIQSSQSGYKRALGNEASFIRSYR